MKRDTRVTIGFVVAAVIILAAQMLLLWTGPAAAQSLAPTEPQDRPDMVQVRILTTDGDLDWTGNIMGSDLISSTIEGEGDDAILMRCDEDDDGGFGSYSVDFTKEDDNDETLAVQIIANANGTLIKEARTDAEFGWISISGDC